MPLARGRVNESDEATSHEFLWEIDQVSVVGKFGRERLEAFHHVCQFWAWMARNHVPVKGA
jgi:hypothetical protein